MKTYSGTTENFENTLQFDNWRLKCKSWIAESWRGGGGA